MATNFSKSMLPTAAALSLAALGMLFLPAKVGDVLRAGLHDAILPGHRLLQLTATEIESALNRLRNPAEDAAKMNKLTTEVNGWKARCRQLQVGNTLLREQIDVLTQHGVSPYRGTPSQPLMVPELLQAAVLCTESDALWRAGTLIDKGTASGVAESTFVLEDLRPIVDQGKAAGLAAGQPVYCGRSVIGKIATVGRWTSTVRRLTDHGFRGEAQLARKTSTGLVFGARGILEGRGKPLCRLKYVPAAEPLSVGDDVYTGTRDATMPYPLHYGRITKAELQPGALHWEIWVEPAIDKVESQVVQILRRRFNPLRQLAQ